MANRDWTFTQLTGSDPKTFTLTGYAAPFGRPRAKPVVSPSKELRMKRTRYPGNSGAPTTHLFGTKLDDQVELTGRWMDKMLGIGSAERNMRLMNEMIDDQRLVRITWGELLSYNGWLVKFTPHWESLNELAWSLIIAIDEDNFESRQVQFKPATSVLHNTSKLISDFLNEGVGSLKTTLPSLNAITGEIFDQLDDMVASVTQFGGAAISIANSISNIETAFFNEIDRLRAGLHQFKTAVLTLRDTVDNLSIDSLIVDRGVEDDIAWLSFSGKANTITTLVLDQITQADTVAETAALLRTKTTYQAKPGDSWESIALMMYGDADRAPDIRAANGITGGSKPVAGHQYIIPV